MNQLTHSQQIDLNPKKKIFNSKFQELKIN